MKMASGSAECRTFLPVFQIHRDFWQNKLYLQHVAAG